MIIESQQGWQEVAMGGVALGVGADEGTAAGRWLARLAAGGAWFFVASSLFAVSWVLWPFSPPRSISPIFHTEAGGIDYYSWGLSYMGPLGLALGLSQMGLVLLAAVLSHARFDAARRLGLIALVAWNGLWLGDAARMFAADGQRLWVLVVSGLGVLMACNLARLILRWRRWRAA